MKKPKPTSYLKISAKGKRLELRAYKLSDFKAVTDSHQARLPSLNKYDVPISTAQDDLAKFKARLKRYRERAKSGDLFLFGIFERKTGRYVGKMDFTVFHREIDWVNLGYHIQNQFFGMGYASEAGRLALKIAFHDLKFYRVEVGADLDNKASQNVAKKIGLQFECVRRKFLPENGGTDLRIYALSKPDYK